MIAYRTSRRIAGELEAEAVRRAQSDGGGGSSGLEGMSNVVHMDDWEPDHFTRLRSLRGDR